MQKPGSNWRAAKSVFILILAVLLVLFWKQTFSGPSKTSAPPAAPAKNVSTKTESVRLHLARKRLNAEPAPDANASTTAGLEPQAMKLEKRILAFRKWNGGPDSFGRYSPPPGQEGATVGPSSLAYVRGKLHLLDNVNKRIMVYDMNGNLLSSIPLPTHTMTDLAVDKTGTQLLVIDHYENKVYKIEGDQLIFFSSISLREDLPIGTKFAFDTESNSLFTQEVHQDGLADIDGNNLIIGPNTDQKMSVAFDRPVACVEEVVTDAKGIVWVLFTLEGDFQMRRIARIDPAGGNVGTAELDVYFPFDSTRHMVAVGDGVVVFAGDPDTGKLISYRYAGLGL
jgi:hypothetical protein